MKILCLYNNDCALELFHWIASQGHETILCKEILDDDWCRQQEFDLTVSYTYRYILKESTLNALSNNVVNLHNSYLPWNRGADPNIWSIVDGSPRGVTLHYMDSDLDRGYIISQELIFGCIDENQETLSSTYNDLDRVARQLFKKTFQYYSYWPTMSKKALGKGSYHSVKDGKQIKSVIDDYGLSIAEFKQRIKQLITNRGL